MTDLISFERAAYGRAPDRIERMIVAVEAMALGRLTIGAAYSEAAALGDNLIQRMAAAVTAVLADPSTRLSRRDIDRLLVLGGPLRQLLQASSFGGPDVILQALAEEQGVAVETLASRAPILSLESRFEWPLSLLRRLEPALAQALLANLIGTSPILSIAGQARRDRILAELPDLPPCDFPRSPDHLVLLTTAWMTCSYAGTAGKHRIKTLFNRTLRDMAQGWGFHDLAVPADRPIKARPTMLVAAEIMHSGHVQFRYFGQYLRQLRTRFELVLLTAESEVDPAVSTLFDRIRTFRRGAPGYLQTIFEHFRETAADVVFWPSVGMRHWGPLFANLRLAPIQFTALGHSASTFCDTIDYYLLEEGYVSDPALFGETVVTLPDDSLVFERTPIYRPVAPALRPSPDPLRIVVPSNLLKLNPRFVQLLGRIAAGAPRALEFHFFPNVTGLELAVTRKMVRRYLNSVVIHPRLGYPKYLEALSAGDLNLSPFPFGGLHSVVDSLRQGLPVVAMECPEPHGRTDAMLIRRLGLPEWLIATTEEEYVATALRLIGDDVLRLEIGRQALALDIDQRMFGDATTPLRHEVLDAVWWMYQNHEAIQAQRRKCWSTADRAALT